MTKLLTETSPATKPDLEVAEGDRRRPGRRAANPVLVPLLRGTPPGRGHAPGASEPPGQAGPAEHFEDDGNAARGIVIGMLLSMPIWASIAAVCYGIFRLLARS